MPKHKLGKCLCEDCRAELRERANQLDMATSEKMTAHEVAQWIRKEILGE